MLCTLIFTHYLQNFSFINPENSEIKAFFDQYRILQTLLTVPAPEDGPVSVGEIKISHTGRPPGALTECLNGERNECCLTRGLLTLCC